MTLEGISTATLPQSARVKLVEQAESESRADGCEGCAAKLTRKLSTQISLCAALRAQQASLTGQAGRQIEIS